MFRPSKFLTYIAALLAVTLAGSIVHTLTIQSVATISVFSTVAFLIVLATSLILLYSNPRNLFAVVPAMFATLVIGRLYSTMRFDDAGGAALSTLDPLLVAETGPGIWSITLISTALAFVLSIAALIIAQRSLSSNNSAAFYANATSADWGMTFLRIYVGLMFIAHFTGHLFGGPIPFNVFENYFGGIGLPYPAAFVIFAGLIELAVAIGLAFGFMTRIAAVGAAIYLFVSVGLGGHYSVGYVWVLPTGGWEFPALWIFATSLFAFVGAGPVSADAWLKQKFTSLPAPIRTSIT